MFNPTMKEQLERQRAINLENAYLIRDLLSDKTGKTLWKIVTTLLATREALCFADMQKASKKTPIYDTESKIVGHQDKDYTLEDFYSQKGLREGLRWLPQEIEDLRDLAEREDQREDEET